VGGREGCPGKEEGLIKYLNAIAQKNHLHELCHGVKLDKDAHNYTSMNHFIDIVHSMINNLCGR
jgi:hypothetical protein